MTQNRPPILVVMGVSGSGKTTVGAMLAERLGWTYADADDFHPPANIEKMRAGIPLTDDDRLPWLRAIGAWMDARREPAVVTCSALKRAYRDVLREGRPNVRLVYLKGDRELIHRRLTARHGHFFPERLLDSQLRDLEPPTADEHPLVVSIDAPVTEIVDRVRNAL